MMLTLSIILSCRKASLSVRKYVSGFHKLCASNTCEIMYGSGRSAANRKRGSYQDCFSKNVASYCWKNTKQESIPVEYVPPAHPSYVLQ